MGKHTGGSGSGSGSGRGRLVPAVAAAAALGLIAGGALVLRDDPSGEPAASTGPVASSSSAAAAAPSPVAEAVDAPAGCDRPALRVVTAASFAPVLAGLAAGLQQDAADCLNLEVTTADGRDAVGKVEAAAADVWIPDDGAWLGSGARLGLAEAPLAGAGTVLATSPLYLVADTATSKRLRRAGDSWLGLSRLVAKDEVELVVNDPRTSGDGLVAAGSVAEAVWQDVDMDASALWLAGAYSWTRIVPREEPALPAKPGEVGIVPEYSLTQALSEDGTNLVVQPGRDLTAMLRYTWLPLKAAADDPERGAMLDRLQRELTGPVAAEALTQAGLRSPDGEAPPAAASLPALKAAPLEVLGVHHADHVFATWYAADRRTNLLVAVDVSGSMANEVEGSSASRIQLVRRGTRSLIDLLPDESRMGLWKFGSALDGSKDYQRLVPMADLGAAQRSRLGSAIGNLDSIPTGTGLYDTVLAAYASALSTYRPGAPNQVLVFTDGRNEDDATSMTSAQLSRRLSAIADPERPVQLSVVIFGTAQDAEVVGKAVAPVGGYVDVLTTADEVAAVFIHVAAGGLHG